MGVPGATAPGTFACASYGRAGLPVAYPRKNSPITPSYRISGTKFALHEPYGPTPGTKFALLARNGPIWRFSCMQGELFRTYTHVRPSRVNFFAPKLLAARRDETVNTNAGSSARLHETRDTFARRNGIKNRCFWRAMVPSVSLETERAPAKVMTVSHSDRTHIERANHHTVTPLCGTALAWIQHPG